MNKSPENTERLNEILSKLQNIFENVTGVQNLPLGLSTSLDKNIGISSFSLIQLICAIEDEFEISIPNAALKSFKTVEDIVEFIISQE